MKIITTLLLLFSVMLCPGQKGLFVSTEGALTNDGNIVVRNGDFEYKSNAVLGGALTIQGLDGEDHKVSFTTKNTLDYLQLYGTSRVLLDGQLNINREIFLNDTASLDIQDSGITLTAGAEIVGEGATTPITGNDGSFIQITENHDAATTEDFGLLGVVVSKTSVSMGSTQIIRHYGTFEIDGNPTVRRYYEVIPTVNENLNANVEFYIDAIDLNGLERDELAAFRSTDNGVSFTNKGGTSDPFSLTVTGVDAFSIWAFADSELLSTEEINTLSAAALYPNPVVGQLHLDLPANLGLETYSIYTVLGEKVQEGKISSEKGTIILPVQNLSAGAYFIIMEGNGVKASAKRFMKL